MGSHDICRTCLSKACSISLFTIQNITNNEITYSDMLFNSINLKIVKNDVTSQYICKNCADEIIRIYEFRQKAFASNEYFENIVKTENDDTNYNIPFEEHIEVRTGFKFVDSEVNQNIASPSFEEQYIDIVNDDPISTSRESGSDDEIDYFSNTPDNLNTLEIQKVELPEYIEPPQIASDNLNTREIQKVELSEYIEPILERIKTESSDTTLKCHVCGRTFKTANFLKRHITRFHETDNLLNPDEEKLHSNNKKNKIQKEKKQTNRIRKEKTINKNSVKVECNQIEKSMPNNSETSTCDDGNDSSETPQAIKTENGYKCSVCSKVLKTKAVAQYHIGRYHLNIYDNPKSQSCLCNVCGQSFSTAGKFTAHYKKHFPELCHKCSLCDKVFTEKSRLKSHELAHSGIKPFRCELCEFKCTSKNWLRIHMMQHKDVTPFECEICKRKFSAPAGLKCHIQSVHENLKPFKCSECGKDFKKKYHLQRHSVIHLKESLRNNEVLDPAEVAAVQNSEQQFSCEVCGLTFTTKCWLKVHLRQHTGERPYECDICKRAFRAHTQRTAHIKTVHLGIKPFKCDECGRNFSRKSHLQDHVKTHS